MAFLNIEIGILGASSVSSKTGVALWEPIVPVGDDSNDVESFGPTPVYQGLGLSSFPWPKDDSGHAECLMVRHCGGRDLVCLGARDTRTESVIGNGKPGDTMLYSTGPSQAAQLQLKEAKRQAVLVTKTSSGKTMAVILDGKNEKLQVTHAGAILEIDADGNISIVSSSGNGILIDGSGIRPIGPFVAGAGNTPGLVFALMTAVPPVTPATGAPLPLIPCLGMAPG